MPSEAEKLAQSQSPSDSEPQNANETSSRMTNLFVVTGPSGVGKGTIIAKILERVPYIAKSVSATTRPMREGERKDVDYFFCSTDEFFKMKLRGEFLEWAKFTEHYYGTPRSWVEKSLSEGQDVILEIEVEGAKQIRQKYPQAVLIFISPPSYDELKSRLQSRATESPERILSRLEKAKEELNAKNLFDYEVINDNLDEAIGNLEHIVYAERARTTR